MIAPLAKLMDWLAIQAVTLIMPAQAADPRLEEALAFLNGPEFIPDVIPHPVLCRTACDLNGSPRRTARPMRHKTDASSQPFEEAQ